MAGRATGAVAVAAVVVGGAAIWNAIRRREAENQYRLYMARLEVEDYGAGRSQAGGINPLVSWGLETLFGAMGGETVEQGRPGEVARAGTPPILANIFGDGRGRSGLSPLLDLIGRAEAPQGYDQVFGGSRLAPPRPITTMTVAEVLAWQDRSVAAGSASSAAGRYQIIRKTLRDIVRAGVLSPNETFSPAAQDRAAEYLLKRRGLDDYRAGRISRDRFGDRLAQEWAGLPVVTGPRAGNSYYAGDGLNSATVGVSDLLTALERL